MSKAAPEDALGEKLNQHAATMTNREQSTNLESNSHVFSILIGYLVHCRVWAS